MTLFSESGAAQTFLALASLQHCRKRKLDFKTKLIEPTGNPWPNNVQISGEWAFHMHDTHGIPVDILPGILWDEIFNE